MITITRKQARLFILAKQGLIGTYKFTGKKGAYEYVRQAGCIQFDPVDVCGKNAELTLQSRVKGFRKPMLADLLYKDRLLVDYADKELSIWPVEDWPYFSSYRERSRKLGKTFNGISKLRKQAISYINENGPVTSSSLPIEGEIFWHSSMHWSGHWDRKSPAARSILEQLYTDGELVIPRTAAVSSTISQKSIFPQRSLAARTRAGMKKSSFHGVCSEGLVPLDFSGIRTAQRFSVFTSMPRREKG